MNGIGLTDRDQTVLDEMAAVFGDDGGEARERIGTTGCKPASVWDTRRDRMAGDPPTIGDLDMPAPKRGDRA